MPNLDDDSLRNYRFHFEFPLQDRIVTVHANTDIHILAGIAQVGNRIIREIHSPPLNVEHPFNIPRLGFPLILINNDIQNGEISIENILKNRRGSVVELPIPIVEIMTSSGPRRFQRPEESEGKFTVNISNGISLIFKLYPITSERMTWNENDTQVLDGTFTVYLTRIQVTTISDGADQ